MLTHQLHHVATFTMNFAAQHMAPCCDSNQGMFEADGRLYLFNTILPSLTVFSMEIKSSKLSKPSLVHTSKLTHDATVWLEGTTGLNMQDVCISGHPTLTAQL